MKKIKKIKPKTYSTESYITETPMGFITTWGLPHDVTDALTETEEKINEIIDVINKMNKEKKDE